MKGYQLMTEEQRQEMDSITERQTHSDIMRFTDIDAQVLAEYNALCERLEIEYKKEIE